MTEAKIKSRESLQPSEKTPAAFALQFWNELEFTSESTIESVRESTKSKLLYSPLFRHERFVYLNGGHRALGCGDHSELRMRRHVARRVHSAHARLLLVINPDQPALFIQFAAKLFMQIA